MRLTMFAYLCLFTIVTWLSTPAHAQTFSVIHNFSETGNGLDGAFPEAGVTISAAVLYGTTPVGGEGIASGPGTVYQMTKVGSNWVYTPIFIFPLDGSGGGGPNARVVFGPDHHLYGTGGTVFKLTPPLSICKTANCGWKEDVLYKFSGGSDGSASGHGDLIWDQQGNIYGATPNGGPSDHGTIYELTRAGDKWNKNVLYTFLTSRGPGGPDGLIFDNNGNLWGTAGGGIGGFIFELTYTVGIGWQEKEAHSFQGSDGLYPSRLTADNSGNFYGATTAGGANGGGTLFEVSPSGDTYTFQVLYSFPPNGGGGPFTMDAAGNLYGTSYSGGVYGLGNVFKLSNTPNGWVYTSLHDFSGPPNDGSYPIGQVAIDADGTLFGTTKWGGSSLFCYGNGCGTVWMIKP